MLVTKDYQNKSVFTENIFESVSIKQIEITVTK